MLPPKALEEGSPCRSGFWRRQLTPGLRPGTLISASVLTSPSPLVRKGSKADSAAEALERSSSPPLGVAGHQTGGKNVVLGFGGEGSQGVGAGEDRKLLLTGSAPGVQA